MKRIVAILLVLLMAIAGLTASAAMAIPNQQLSFRTGPNTRYTELFTLPQSTFITPIELEEGNGVTWVLCKFSYNGYTYYGYTGLKRMEIMGEIYYPGHEYTSAYMYDASAVYSATSNGTKNGNVSSLEMVNILKYEDGYAYIEFYNSGAKAPARGWVPEHELCTTDLLSAFALESSNVYKEPTSSSGKIGKVGKFEMLGYIGTENGYDCIAFYSASNKAIMTGYVPSSIVDAYEF